MEIEFYKLSGAGNDFMVLDNRNGKIPESARKSIFSTWCRRGMSIGADGVLLVENPSDPSTANFKMRYYNADGGEAETCGNGSRCIARFAFDQGIAPREMTFETLAGNYEAIVLEGGDVRLRMSDAFGLELKKAVLPNPDLAVPVDFVNTGVPHAVLIVSDVKETDVVNLGRALRHDEAFSPAGTNVNFVEVTGPDQIKVRTYERGVEDETLACGTGCIASAIIGVRHGRISAPVEVTTASGESLQVNFTPTAEGAANVTLQGSAHLVFRGYVNSPE